MENKNEKKYYDSEDDSFNKNINCISDDESDDSITKRKSNNEKSIKNELNDLKENNISKAIKKKRIQELIEEIEQSEKANNRTKNLNNQIYNKKNIKLSSIENNKENEEKNFQKKRKINFNQIDNDIKKMNQVIDIFAKKKIINNKINNNTEIIKSKNVEDDSKLTIKNKKIIINNNDLMNNRSLDTIFKKDENTFI